MAVTVRADPAAPRQSLLGLVDLYIAAAQGTALGRPSVYGDGERIVGSRLPIVGHVDGEGAWRIVLDAGAAQHGRVAVDHQRRKGHAVDVRPTRVIDVLEGSADRPRGRLRLYDETEGPTSSRDINRASSCHLANRQWRREHSSRGLPNPSRALVIGEVHC